MLKNESSQKNPTKDPRIFLPRNFFHGKPILHSKVPRLTSFIFQPCRTFDKIFHRNRSFYFPRGQLEPGAITGSKVTTRHSLHQPRGSIILNLMRQDKLHPAERRLSQSSSSSPSWSSFLASTMADDFTPWGRDSSRPSSLRKTTSSLLDPPSHATRQIANKQVPSIALSQVLCILNVPGFGTYEPPSWENLDVAF